LRRRELLTGTLFLLAVFVPMEVSGQRVRIADLSMSRLNASPHTYTSFSETVARFDVVAADDLGDAGGMEKVLAGMDEGWEASVSRGGYFGFIYSERVQMVKELGTYSGKSDFAQP